MFRNSLATVVIAATWACGHQPSVSEISAFSTAGRVVDERDVVTRLDAIGEGGWDFSQSKSQFCPGLVDRADRFAELVVEWAEKNALPVRKQSVEKGRALVLLGTKPPADGLYGFLYRFDEGSIRATVKLLEYPKNGGGFEPSSLPDSDHVTRMLAAMACGQ